MESKGINSIAFVDEASPRIWTMTQIIIEENRHLLRRSTTNMVVVGLSFIYPVL